MTAVPDTLVHAVRILAAGRRPAGLKRRWKYLVDRGLVSGTPQQPVVTAIGRAVLGQQPRSEAAR